jgi:2-dehydropantoate 2-reductase
MESGLRSKRICIVGAGAIGGLLGVRLSRNHIVTFHARGAHLAAMLDASAMLLVSPDGIETKSAPSSLFVSSLDCVPPQDFVILGLKTHQISSVLPSLTALLERSPGATLVTTQNGVPWWFFQQFSGPHEFRDLPLLSVDPDGALFHGIDPKRIVATVVYPAAHIAAPGIVQHTDGLRFPVGEPSGDVSTSRITELSSILMDAGFKAPILSDVRGELWLKLWGSVALNPLSALTHATLEKLCTFPKSRRVVAAMMKEVENVATAVGVTLRLPLERRIDGAAKVGNHKTSTLQDCESGRPMEVDAIMGGVIEIARITDTPTPHVDAIYGAISLLAHVLESEKAALPLVPST